MGPPGFEPESQAPKAQRIDQATLRTHIQTVCRLHTNNNLIFMVYKHYYNTTIFTKIQFLQIE